MSMKYTFIDDNGQSRTVNISDEVFLQGKKEGLSTQETIERYLSDEGYVVNAEVTRLTKKAKENGAGLHEKSGTRKPPVRKPDENKRMLIQLLYDSLLSAETVKSLSNVQIKNIERIISFSIGEDDFELTLSKKRKAK